MRKVLFAATALVAALAIASVAQGGSATTPGGMTQTLEVTHSPTKPKKGTFVNVVLSTRCDPTKQCQAPPAPLGKAAAVTKTVVHLPKGMKTGYKDFPKCDPKKLQSSGLKGCSKKAIVGKGKLTADGRPVVDTPVAGSVTAFNGTNARYLLYVIPELSSPLVIMRTSVPTVVSIFGMGPPPSHYRTLPGSMAPDPTR